ncbi:MAG: purine-nucleoside phosphorylase [Bacteroidetes bacterium]|nr:purine-nucleoside phosphorylase [Bacteroidota bacterium]
MSTDVATLTQALAGQIRARYQGVPDLAIILGSGLGDFATTLTDPVIIPVSELSGYPASTVDGHAGQIIFGKSGGKTVLAFKGRLHVYEGYEPALTVIPVWIARHLGVKTLIVTNAAGGINPGFSVGDLMLITDHIGFQFRNPLIGPNPDQMGPRFPDMSEPYDRGLIARAEEIAIREGILCRKGVYLALTGPSYETPAEIRMLRVLGADAVGMSTVMEVIQAAHLGLRVLGISLISNMASGMSDSKLSHSEVNEVGQARKAVFTRWIHSIISEL